MNSTGKIPTAQKQRMLFAGLVLIAAMGWPQLVRGESQQDLLFFLSLGWTDNFSSSEPAIEQSDFQSVADILYTYNNDRFKFLGEYVWSDSENELERLKVGWQANDRTLLWLGRFHTTTKFWTTEFHHGQFLQTSISRPGLEEWEDESGPLPSHLTGVALQHDYLRADQSVLSFGLALGLAPKFSGQELIPYDLLDSQGGHEPAFNYRMTYRPDILSTNQFGLSVAWNDISVDSDSNLSLADLRTIRQTTVGLYADWKWTAWRLMTSWMYFDNELQSLASVEKDEFAAAYVQGEYEASEDWTIFGRTEVAFGEDRSPYLQLLPAFVAHRHMLGVRWDFDEIQSLTLEIADTSTQGDNFMHDNFKELQLQWSAVFP